MYTNILCLVFVILTLSEVICANMSMSRNLKHREYDRHRRRVDTFQKKHPCGEPVETLVPLSEISFTRKIHANEQIFPEITVLHRCNSYAQCKKPANRCEQETNEMIELTFFVTSIDGTSKDYVKGYGQNHTSCFCKVK